jgi:hypothetical protein
VEANVAKQILINAITVRDELQWPGTEVDDVADAALAAGLTAAGALLWPATDPKMVEAAEKARAVRRQAGPVETAENIMQGAVRASQNECIDGSGGAAASDAASAPAASMSLDGTDPPCPTC